MPNKMSDQDKIVKIKALQLELSTALQEAKSYTGKDNRDQTTFAKIEGILDQIDTLTKPTMDGKDAADTKETKPVDSKKK